MNIKPPSKARLLTEYIDILSCNVEKERIIRWLINSIRESLELNEVLSSTVNEVGQLLKVDRCLIVLYNPKNSKFYLKSEYKSANNLKSVINSIKVKDVPPEWYSSLIKNNPIFVDNTENCNLIDDTYRQYFQEYDIKSFIIIPIVHKGELQGAIVAHQVKSCREWTSGQIDILRDISNQIAIAIRQAKFYCDQKKRADREKLLRTIISAIRSSFDIKEIKNIVVNEIGKTLKADRVIIGDFDERTEKFLDAEEGSEYLSSSSMKSLVGTSIELESNKPVKNLFKQELKCSVQSDTEKFIIDNHLENTDSAQFLETYNIKAAIGMPILYSGKLIGILAIHYAEKKDDIDEEEIEFIRTLSNQIGIAIYQTRLYKTVKNNAHKEALLRKITNTIRSSLDIDETLQIICEELTRVFNVEIATIIEYPYKDDFLKAIKRAEYTTLDMGSLNIQGMKIDNRILEYWGENVIGQARTLAFNDLLNADIPDYIRQTYERIGGKSILALPIKQGEDVWGGLGLTELTKYRCWAEDEIALFETIADQIYVAIKQAELYSKTKKQAERESALRAIVGTIRSTLDIKEIKKNIVNEIGSYLNASRCFIYEFDPERGLPLSVDGNSEYLSSPLEKSAVGLDCSEEKIRYWTNNTINHKRELIISDSEEYINQYNLCNSEAHKLLQEFNIKASIGTPILYNDRIYGELVIHFSEPQSSFNEDDIKFIRTLSNQVGIALYQSRLYNTVKQNADRESLLRKIFTVIRSSLDIDETLKVICDEVAKLFNVDRATIIEFTDLQDFTNWKIRREYKNKGNTKGISDNTDFDKRVGIIWAKAFSEDSNNLIIENIALSDTPDYFRKSYELLGQKAIAVVPIKADSNKWGVIILSEYEYHRSWTQDEITLLETIADHIYIAIKQSELYTITKKQAERELLLRRITDTIRSSLDISSIKNIIVNEVGKIFNADRCFIWTYDHEKKCFDAVDKSSEYLSSKDELSVTDYCLDNFSCEFLRSISNQDNSINISNLDAHDFEYQELKELFQSFNVKSNYSCPIFNEDQFIGRFILHYTRQEVILSEDELKLLRTIANQTGIAIKQAELYSKTKIQADRERLLRNISNTIRSSLNVNEIKRKIVTEIGKALNADRCFIREFDLENDRFLPIDSFSEYLSSPEIKTLVSNDRYQRGFEFFPRAYLDNKRDFIFTTVDDLFRDYNLPHLDSDKVVKDYSVKSLAIIPLYHHDKPIGILALHYIKNKVLINEEERKFLVTLGNQSGIALYQAKLYAAKKQKAEREILLRNVITAIRGTLDLKEVLNIVCREIAGIFNVQRILIGDFKGEVGEKNKILTEYVIDSSIMGFRDLIDYEAVRVYWHKIIIQEGRIHAINNINTSDEPDCFKIPYVNMGIKSVIGIPIKTDNKNWGGLFLTEYNNFRSWMQEDIDLLENLADHISIAIRHANMHSTIRNQIERESLLRNIMETIRNSLDIEETLKSICNEIARIFNVERVAILEFIDRGNFSNWIIREEFKVNRFLRGLKDTQPCVRTGDYWKSLCKTDNTPSFAINDISKSDAPDYFKEMYNSLGVKSLLVMPIKKDKELWGAIGLSVYSYTKCWTQEEISLLETITDQIYVAIRQAEMFSTIKNQLEKEQLLRSDSSIVINKNLAKNIGLNCAITYSTLKSLFYNFKDQGKLDENGFFICNIHDIRQYTHLNESEQKEAIRRLYEFGLVDYKKEHNNYYYFNVIEDDSIIEHYLVTSTIDYQSENFLNYKDINNKYFEISKLCRLYSKYFSKESSEAAKYFLSKSIQLKSDGRLEVSKSYFAVICRTLHDFMTQYKLDLNRIKSIINLWFNVKEIQYSSCVLNFGLSDKILLGRLKKILLYRLKEAHLLAIDFNSKIDFYTNLDFSSIWNDDEEDIDNDFDE